ncbi:Primase C terminal 2 (PriCT-2) [Novosphingobium sp. CF614]|nr:Primase C terminal 2 (PriCT-2) [Novosphingobium sp. CF614]
MQSIHESAGSGKNPAVPFTWFTRADAPQGQRGEIIWSDLCQWIVTSAPTAPTKDALPLIKLATFTGDYRNDAGLEAVHGIEGDYDAEQVQPQDAAAMLQRAGIAALIYTSPSHQPDAPRWRVLAPLSRSDGLTGRHALACRINGALGGILARESFTASQAYYVGAVEGGEPVQCWATNGQCIDLVEGIAPIGPAEPSSDPRKPLGTEPAPHPDAPREALWSIDPNELGYADWRNMSAAFRQASTGLMLDEAARIIWDVWCQRFEKNSLADNAKLWRSLDRGTSLGWAYLRSRAAPEVVARWTFGVNGPSLSAVPSGATQEVLPAIQYEIPATGDTVGAPSHLDVVRNCRDWAIPVRHDTFADRLMVTGPLPGERNSRWPRPLTDSDYVTIRLAFNAMGTKPPTEALREGVDFWARANPFNPVTDWLDGLRWDGVARLDGWLSTYLGVEPSDWSRAIGSRFIIGMVARAMVPGCKLDTVLVLEGPQGVGKSTALRILAGDDHFGDQLPNMRDKDGLAYLSGLWLVEIGELAAMRRSHADEIKSFLTARFDRYRPSYGRHMIDQPRRVAFAASTNDSAWHDDPTGARRWWPVRVGSIDLEGLVRDRAQLFAEAVHRWRSGEAWHLDADGEALGRAEMAEREVPDAWEERIAECLAANPAVPMTIKALLATLGIASDTSHSGHTRRLSGILRNLGYERKRLPDRRWAYVKPSHLS